MYSCKPSRRLNEVVKESFEKKKEKMGGVKRNKPQIQLRLSS